MEGGVETLNKPVVLKKWRIVIPRVGNTMKSAKFYWHGKYWTFVIDTQWEKWCDDEVWTMHLKNLSKEANHKRFILTAYVKDISEDLYMVHQEISSTDTEIWNYRKNSFIKSFPRIKVTREIEFSFEFVSLERADRNFVHGHKSTQTPCYTNDSLCRENLSLHLRKLMEDGSNSDVQLKCGDCIIPAHKLILGARSEVFRAMLQSDMLEGREGSVQIVDMEPKIFEMFIRYLYAGILPELTGDTVAPLYEAGDKYRLEALKTRCGEFLADNLTLENACGVLVMVDAHNDHQLKDRVVSYIIREKVPDDEEDWRKFCDDNPRLAIEVLNRAWQTLS